MNFINKIKNSFSQIDLTKGKPMKVLFIFMLPILFSLLFQQIYIISDAAIVGQNLSKSEVAGVNDVYGLFFIVIQFAFGCTSGFSVITSNMYGEKNENGMRRSFATQIILSFIISLILTCIVLPLTPTFLKIIGIDKNGSVYKYAYTYLIIIYAGLIGQIFYNLAVSVLRSIGDSFVPLLLLITSTIINIFLDLLFIIVFKLGVGGAAFATVLSQCMAAIGSFVYIFKKYPFLSFKISDFKITFKDAWNHLKLGLPLAFQFSILAIGLIVLQSCVIKFDVGDVQNAQNGYGVAVKFNDFLYTPFSALGTALLSYQGQNFGAKNLNRIKEGFKDAFILTMIFYVILGGIGILFSIKGTYVYLFLNKKNINDRLLFYASRYMLVDASLYFILGILFISRNALQGLGKPIYPFLAGVAELIGRLSICTFLPQIVDPTNPISDKAYIGLCFSDSTAWLLAIIVMGYGVFKYIIKGKIELSFSLDKENIQACN